MSRFLLSDTTSGIIHYHTGKFVQVLVKTYVHYFHFLFKVKAHHYLIMHSLMYQGRLLWSKHTGQVSPTNLCKSAAL